MYITVAGLSDALSGFVSGSTNYPVIACPPDFEKLGWPETKVVMRFWLFTIITGLFGLLIALI